MAVVTVHQAYRFALDPTPRQQRALASHVGAARFAFNWGLALVKEGLDRRATGEDVRVPWTLFELRREWNQVKGQVAPWWRENSKEAYSSGLDGLARALKNWADSRHGRRTSQTVGFPRFKHKGRGRDVCRFTTGVIRLEPDRHHVVLPRLGRIKTHESTRKLARRHGPLAPDGGRRTPSVGWQQTRHRLVQMHARVASVRRDGLHQFTSDLAQTYGMVVVEHLNVAGMLRNRRLARRIADAGFGELRRQLSYKTTWAGGKLIAADTFYPSSKTCSGCGHVKAKLPLSERTYRCERCGLVLDRDYNAARNLAALVGTPMGSGVVAGSGLETANARGVDVRPGFAGQTAVNREAGTGPCLGETGTAGAQAPTTRIAGKLLIRVTEDG